MRNPDNSHATTQRARQLDAIEFSLKMIVQRLQRGEAANDAYHGRDNSMQSPLVTRRDSEAVQLLTSCRQQDAYPFSLQIAPLFPHSHSQPDVTVSIQQESDNLDPSPMWRPEPSATSAAIAAATTENKHTAIHLLSPEYHFVQFSNHSDKSYACFDRESINLAVILPDDNFSSQSTPIENLNKNPLLGLANIITFVSWGKATNNLPPRVVALQNRLLNELRMSVEADTRTVQIGKDDSIGLLHLLSQHDIAVLPNSGLAMDALNVDCVSTIWNSAGRHSLCTDEQINLTRELDENNNVVQVRGLLRKIAAKQRKSLVNEKLIDTQGMLVTTRIQQLAHAVESFSIDTRNEWSAERGKSWIPTLHDWASERSIIPQATQKPTDLSLTWSSSYNKACRKLRKLHRSPGQFLNDSQFPVLRSLSSRHARYRK